MYFLILQQERQPGQKMKMNARGRADHGKDSRNFLSIERVEIDGFFQKAEQDRGFLDIENDGISDMRYRNTVPDAGRSKGFPRHYGLEYEFLFRGADAREKRYDFLNHSGFCFTAGKKMNAPFFNSIGKKGKVFEGDIGCGKKIRRYINGTSDRPFKKFGFIEETGFIQAEIGDFIPFYKAVELFFRQI
jgi:hypothetical protein